MHIPNITSYKNYTWGLYIDELLSYTDHSDPINPQTYYVTTDRQYSVRTLVDSDGNIVEERNYSPIGVDLEGNAETSDLAYGFTGRRYDSESDLYYFRARYYSSELGQFISRDPLEYVDGMNMYSGYFARRFNLDPYGFNECELGECEIEISDYGKTSGVEYGLYLIGGGSLEIGETGEDVDFEALDPFEAVEKIAEKIVKKMLGKLFLKRVLGPAIHGASGSMGAAGYFVDGIYLNIGVTDVKYKVRHCKCPIPIIFDRKFGDWEEKDGQDVTARVEESFNNGNVNPTNIELIKQKARSAANRLKPAMEKQLKQAIMTGIEKLEECKNVKK